MAEANKSVDQGEWGERVACLHLRNRGWRILERDATPCARDARLDVDIIAFDPAEERVVFVEVKTHVRRSPYAARLWAVDRRKKQCLLRVCACWLRAHRWHGNYRFDVIEVYGEHGSGVPPEIDHVENVPLFPAKWRFW